MQTLYVVRHGETVWNREGRLQGRLDSALTPEGQQQADTNGRCLKQMGGVDVVFASPMGRTRETAYLINSHVQAPVFFEDALVERDCGEWSGLSTVEVEARFPEAWQARLRDPYTFRVPGGENLPDMRERVRGFLEGLFELEHDSVLLVTHGVMSRVIISYLLGLAPGDTQRLKHPNDLLYRLTVNATEMVPHHFLGGRGPVDGLLRKDDDVPRGLLHNIDDGTIHRPDMRDDDGS